MKFKLARIINICHPEFISGSYRQLKEMLKRVQHDKRKMKGFTLIELLVVVAIIGILSSFAFANYAGARSRARDAQRKADLRQLQSAFELYRADQGSYPSSPLPACGSALTSGGATYIQKIPCDPQNTGKYIYSYIVSGSTYTLISCLENVNDSQKDTANNATYCNGGTTNWSYTLINP